MSNITTKEVAKAITFLHEQTISVDNGDFFRYQLSWFCDEAGLEYDEEQLEDDTMWELCTQAHEYLLDNQDYDCINKILEKLFFPLSKKGPKVIMENLVLPECQDIKEHPVYKALVTLDTFIDSLGQRACEEKFLVLLKELIKEMTYVDMEIVNKAHAVCDKYAAIVKTELPYSYTSPNMDGDYKEEYTGVLPGQYTFFHYGSNPAKYGLWKYGFAIVFDRVGTDMVAMFYAFRQKTYFTSKQFKKLEGSVIVGDDIGKSTYTIVKVLLKEGRKAYLAFLLKNATKGL